MIAYHFVDASEPALGLLDCVDASESALGPFDRVVPADVVSLR